MKEIKATMKMEKGQVMKRFKCLENDTIYLFSK